MNFEYVLLIIVYSIGVIGLFFSCFLNDNRNKSFWITFLSSLFIGLIWPILMSGQIFNILDFYSKKEK